MDAKGYHTALVGRTIGYYGVGKGADTVRVEAIAANEVSVYCTKTHQDAEHADVTPIDVEYINPPNDDPVIS